MKTFSKRYSIKIPVNIEAFYCDKRQIMLINGPFGKKILKLQVKIEMLKDDNLIKVLDSPFKKLSNKDKKTLKSSRGTTVALIKQTFLEVSTTICKKLNLVGVGYKVFPVETAQGNLIHLKLGYSHSLYFKIPETVNVKCYKADKLFISGHNLSQVAQTAALIRSCKAPEPYKGKGISYNSEVIKLKEGKKV
jgi:large subunit ribosomal protein L6|tara:strand:- start:4616 stop:5191 length:576 start_codon:yes stop_codon:yes gene_type:complete